MATGRAPPGPVQGPERERIRRQSRVVAGLLLTFGGLLLALGSLPSDAGALRSALPLLGGALLAVWAGGILLGAARSPRRTAPG